MIPVIFAVVLLAVIVVLFSGKKKEKSGNWIQFLSKGKENGFSFKEVELLRRLAVKCEIKDPCSIFTTQNQLDKCIRSMVRGIRTSGESEEQGTQDFLSKLYDYRKKIEMNKPKFKTGITSSRQISEGQLLRILVPGAGVFNSEVIKVVSSYLTISRPVNKKTPGSMAWNGIRISVYFWREDDAGYVFDSMVSDEVFSKGVSSLKIDHSDSLLRTQKRRSIRIKLHKPAFLYLSNENDMPGKLELAPGLKCSLEDLSDTGCAVTVGGRASTGVKVKVQFALSGDPVCILGTIRSADYRGETNRSLLHIEADPLPIEMRNHILGEVFDMLPDEDEEELSFQELEDEAEILSPHADSGIPREFMEN